MKSYFNLSCQALKGTGEKDMAEGAVRQWVGKEEFTLNNKIKKQKGGEEKCQDLTEQVPRD
jgi:hypothetical protein